ncbi:MAG: radical SAM protein [Candidatus Nezhaarchaeota archaeon]|nr:radical SAM protein [Candidatus Nezhaarchaeota archaeon]
MSIITPFDPWKGKFCTCPPKYSFSPYTGCSHKCLYCYATSYIRVSESRPKVDLERRLMRDLVKINRELPISMSNSSDPYPPIEASLGLTRRCLEILLPRGLKIMIITKSNIIVRDVDLISRGNCAVSFTITTLEYDLASIMEPGAPKPKERLKAVKCLSQAGIPCVIRVDPIVPGLNDDERKLRKLIEEAVKCGVKHVSSSTYKAKPDNLARMVKAFPDKAKYWYVLYYEEGFKLGSSRYLRDDVRLNLMKMVKEIVDDLGITFSTCREGFTHLTTSTTCDASHLIPSRIKVRGLHDS